MTTNRPRVAHLLGEALVITASILFAFSLDAWWDRHQEREEEQKLLTALASEFVGVDAELVRAGAVHEARTEAARTLIRISDTQAPLPAADSLLSLMMRSWLGTTTDPPNGVLSGAVAGGKLSLIQNDSLRALLAGWSGRIEDHQKTEELDVQYVVQILTPWLAEHDVMWPLDESALRWHTRAVLVARDRTYRGHLFFIGRGSAVEENGRLRSHVAVIDRLINESLR